LLDNTVGVVVQRGCAKWRARVIRNWLLIHILLPELENKHQGKVNKLSCQPTKYSAQQQHHKLDKKWVLSSPVFNKAFPKRKNKKLKSIIPCQNNKGPNTSGWPQFLIKMASGESSLGPQ